jgi:AMMECR1 domain-containing protein
MPRATVPLFLMLAFLLLPQARLIADGSDLSGWRSADPGVRAAALRLARHAFDAYLQDRTVVDPPDALPALLQGRVGVFVSTMIHGAPRCCMGSLYPTQADTAHEIIAAAVAAAGNDHRFAPVTPAEAKRLTLIVSFVGTPRAIDEATARQLDPVRDGLVAQRGDKYGVVLSGETAQPDRMLRWALIRAGAKRASDARFYQIDDVRIAETNPPPPPATGGAKNP